MQTLKERTTMEYAKRNARIVKLAAGGMSHTAIGNKEGISRQAVHFICSRAALVARIC